MIRALLLAALLFVPQAEAAKRSGSVVREFQREVPCPATGKRRGRCPGYQADHVVPLCAGGADDWRNFQWLTLHEHKVKTKEDVRYCAALRRDGIRINRSTQ